MKKKDLERRRDIGRKTVLKFSSCTKSIVYNGKTVKLEVRL
jgi:hypothetical protein